jgi:fused signal recognition particle receptor
MFDIKTSKQADKKTSRQRLFSRLKQGLQRTHTLLLTDVGDLIQGKTDINQDDLDNLEEHLLMADLGIKATTAIMDNLNARIKQDQQDVPGRIKMQSAIQDIMQGILEPVEQPLIIPASGNKPFVILMAGVNGVGKTTSIGKLANYFMEQGYTVMLAAGDTFRAAAIEQLQAWGDRNKVTVIAQQSGADSASVIYDALQAARARSIDILIADTAGRLHTQGNLMDELRKIRRVITKFDSTLVPECLLVLDAGTGQNTLAQAREFHDAIGVTGIIITKLDGTAKGGIVFALAEEMKIPIRFIGIGEQLDDLQVFNSQDYVTALLGPDL